MSTSQKDDLWCGFPRTLFELEERFATEEACREYWIDLRWAGKIGCKRCGCALFECADCGHQTSLTSGTLLAGTRKPLKT